MFYRATDILRNLPGSVRNHVGQTFNPSSHYLNHARNALYEAIAYAFGALLNQTHHGLGVFGDLRVKLPAMGGQGVNTPLHRTTNPGNGSCDAAFEPISFRSQSRLDFLPLL